VIYVVLSKLDGKLPRNLGNEDGNGSRLQFPTNRIHPPDVRAIVNCSVPGCREPIRWGELQKQKEKVAAEPICKN